MTTQIRDGALDLDYIHVIRLYLDTAGLWPNEIFFPSTMRTHILSIYHKVTLAILVYAEISALFLVRVRMRTHSFIDLGQDYLSILMSFVMITRMTLKLQKKYRSVIKNFVAKFHLLNHECDSKFATKEYEKVNKICRIATIVILLECLMGQVMFNAVPIYVNFQAGLFTDRDHRPPNVTFVHSINYYFIIDQYNDAIGYTIVSFLNGFISYICGVLFCGLDLLIYVIVFHILGHFNILVDKMRSFPRPMCCPDESEESLEKKYNEEAFELLKNLIQHDQLIKEFLNDTSTTFSITLCICLFFHQVSGCISLLEISPMTAEALIRYGPLLLVLYNQLIQMCVIFELISSKSDTLSNEAYALPWEQMDNRNRKTLLLFLVNVQKPRGLKAGGLVSVGVLIMSQIIKNSFSYFLILRTAGNL
ncbi:putative odorant receptor 92a [Leguminivora glycinivorella]|uniref:putative odorant receptor 92a n=1 Tax=Leguminivora glycinivorella TaxID=1035111 RepID=UPI00200CFA3B|nr:putative odorant receptor 92a [Leguminivora glycinivorella]